MIWGGPPPEATTALPAQHCPSDCAPLSWPESATEPAQAGWRTGVLGFTPSARPTLTGGCGMMEHVWQAAGFVAALVFVLLNVALAWIIAYKNILHKLPLLKRILHSLFDWEVKEAEKAPPPSSPAAAAARRRPSEGVPRPHAS